MKRVHQDKHYIIQYFLIVNLVEIIGDPTFLIQVLKYIFAYLEDSQQHIQTDVEDVRQFVFYRPHHTVKHGRKLVRRTRKQH